MKQKIPFIILFLLSFIGVNSEFIVFSNESGNEPICENGVYQIKTADELKWFRCERIYMQRYRLIGDLLGKYGKLDSYRQGLFCFLYG